MFAAIAFAIYLTCCAGMLLYGLNCYILAQIAPHISLGEIFRGVVPFVLLTLACIAAFTIWPQIVLWLPQQMFGR